MPFSRDYPLFKRLFKGHRGLRGFDPHPFHLALLMLAYMVVVSPFLCEAASAEYVTLPKVATPEAGQKSF